MLLAGEEAAELDFTERVRGLAALGALVRVLEADHHVITEVRGEVAVGLEILQVAPSIWWVCWNAVDMPLPP